MLCRYHNLSLIIMKNKIHYYLLGFMAVLLAGCNSIYPKSDEDTIDLHRVVSKDDLKGLSSEHLRELTGHELAWTRDAAVQVLVDRGPENLPFFLNSLEDKDWRVIRAGQDGIHAMLRKTGKAGKENKDPLRKKLLKAIPALEKNLKHEHYYVRMGALRCFQAMGSDAASVGPSICACAGDPDDWGVVPAALSTIKAVGYENFSFKDLFPVMEKCIKSRYLFTRGAAIGLIENLDEKDQRKLIPAMQYALNHWLCDGCSRFNIQAHIARLLQKLNVKGTKEQIIFLLTDNGWGVDQRITLFVPLLEQYGGDAADTIPFLENLLKTYEEHFPKRDKGKIIRETIKKIKEAKAKEGKTK